MHGDGKKNLQLTDDKGLVNILVAIVYRLVKFV